MFGLDKDTSGAWPPGTKPPALQQPTTPNHQERTKAPRVPQTHQTNEENWYRQPEQRHVGVQLTPPEKKPKKVAKKKRKKVAKKQPEESARPFRFVQEGDEKNPHVIPACGTIPYTGGSNKGRSFSREDVELPRMVG